MLTLDNNKMNTKIQILLALVAAATGSFLQRPSNHFHQVAFNSTFLANNERLFRPIIIPNATREDSKIKETHKARASEPILKKILKPEEFTLRENYLDEEPKAAKFSSRYSTKHEKSSEKARPDSSEKLEGDSETTKIPDSSERNEDSREDAPTKEVERSFSTRSEDSEEEKEDISERRDAEESEISPTTNEPYGVLQSPTSFRNEDSKHYETSSSAEDTDSSEEEKEDRRSAEGYKDYYNSGSKNYHSIQTPLNMIKYKGPHSLDDDFESEKTRTRLISPIRRRPGTHNWPFSKPQLTEELDKLNEISDSDEIYEKTLDEEIREEVKAKPKRPELELAAEKDELKFDRNKKYNYIEERNQRKEKQKGLIAEEEKDDSRPLLQSLKQYQVDEKHPKYPHQPKLREGGWTTKPPQAFKAPKKFSNLTPSFQGHQFLGPVVFSENTEQERTKPRPSYIRAQTQARRGALKGLLENEKRDQDNLTNQKFEKSIFRTGSQITQSFNHLEESNEMYNAILANIQSVFGIRIHPSKSDGGSQKRGGEASLDESRYLTWSLPPKQEKVN